MQHEFDGARNLTWEPALAAVLTPQVQFQPAILIMTAFNGIPTSSVSKRIVSVQLLSVLAVAIVSCFSEPGLV